MVTGLINTVNYYLGLPQVAELKAAGTSNDGLEGFIYEAMRLDPPFRGVYREAISEQTISGKKVEKGQKVFIDLAEASRDVSVNAVRPAGY